MIEAVLETRAIIGEGTVDLVAGWLARKGSYQRMARPVCKWISRSGLIGLRQRIRSQGIALAKMELRAFWSS